MARPGVNTIFEQMAL